jgi:hypothetical protein
MALRDFPISAFALLACCVMALVSEPATAGSTDAIFIAPSVGTKEAAPWSAVKAKTPDKAAPEPEPTQHER